MLRKLWRLAVDRPAFFGLCMVAAAEAVIKAYLALDLRPRNHLANKYISCRIIKNISYGQMGITNCPATYEFFDGDVAYDSDPFHLFDVACKMRANPHTEQRVLRQMTKIKEKHTYVNRLRDMISAAEAE